MFTWWDKREQYLPCTLKQLANSCAPAQKLPYLIPCQPQKYTSGRLGRVITVMMLSFLKFSTQYKGFV